MSSTVCIPKRVPPTAAAAATTGRPGMRWNRPRSVRASRPSSADSKSCRRARRVVARTRGWARLSTGGALALRGSGAGEGEY
eukprot:9495761-Pyramimonas_sp.AAC.2